MDNILTLKKAMESADAELRTAARRAIWLENRMYNATTEDDFLRLSAELDKATDAIEPLALSALHARFAYAAADTLTGK